MKMKNRKYTQDVILINPLDIIIRQKTIYYKLIEHTKHIHITSLPYYIIKQGIYKTCPCTTLQNTWNNMFNTTIQWNHQVITFPKVSQANRWKCRGKNGQT